MAPVIDMVARLLPRDADPKVVALRWGFPADQFFPGKGYTLTRTEGGVGVVIPGEWKLPGVDAGVDGWLISDDMFQQDVLARTAQPFGAPASTAQEAAELRPLLVFALDEPDSAAIEQGLPRVAEQLGDSHAGDESLAERFWPNGTAPTAADVVASGQLDLYDAVVAHYRAQSVDLLLMAALDFGTARLLGLGLEDVLAIGADPSSYTITGRWTQAASVHVGVLAPAAAWPEAPTGLLAASGSATAGYPPFAFHYGDLARRQPILPADEALGQQMVRAAWRGPRLYPTPTARLTWTPPELGALPGRDGPPPLLTHGPCFWRVERHHVLTAEPDVPDRPNVAADAVFTVCHDGERIARQTVSAFEDDLDLPWGEQPLEGWYAYRVAGIDLFGMIGAPSDVGLIHLRDTCAPPPPRPSIDAHRLTLADNAVTILPLSLDWDAEQELTAPDTVEFRVGQVWTSVEHVPLLVLGVDPISDPGSTALDHVQTDVRVADADGLAWGPGRLAHLTGGTLLTPDGEFAILALRGDSVIRVRRSAGRAPPIGAAAARFAVRATPSPAPRIVPRTAVRVGRISVRSNAPPIVTLTDPTGALVPSGEGRLYAHLLGVSLAVRPHDDGVGFIIDRPVGAGADAQAHDLVTRRDLAEVQAFLDGSPAVLLPPHRLDLMLSPPAGFAAGSLRIEVSAVDATGNQGPAADVVIPAFGNAPPEARPGPLPRLWAKDAAEYVETAEVTLRWSPMDNAVRYEVERALETALGLRPEDEDELLIQAAETIGEEHGFGRLTDSAFLPRWTDRLPGRAPTRAIYRARGVSATGDASAWVLVALVRVPDVRVPPRPILVEAIPAPGRERVIQLCWTQPGPPAGVGFAVETRAALAGHYRDERLDPAEGWMRLADLLPSAIRTEGAGRYRTMIPDLEPGRWFDFRVTPIRHALDPDDPRAHDMRRIDGHPSNVMRARAYGTLRAPANVRIIATDLGAVTIRWSNMDVYRALELRWRPPGKSGFNRQAVGARVEAFSGLTLDDVGDWQFELVAVGHGCRAVSERVELTWPRP